MSESEETGTTAGAGAAEDPGMPRWVKVFIAVAVALVVVFIATQFIGGGHDPGRHGGAPPATEDESDRSPVDDTP